MAINKAVAHPPKSHAGLKNCIDYVLRTDKITADLTAVTGPYEADLVQSKLVYQAFLKEKKIWNKDNGRMCAHNVISWHKDEQITPEQAFDFGLEFAEKCFPNHQTLVAVHLDRDHIHCHLVTNSVSFIDGRKLHSSKKDLEKMKQMTNEMCRQKSLTVAEKGKHFDGSDIELGEVISWDKDKYKMFQINNKQSFVWDCAIAVLEAVKECFDQATFIERMKNAGWIVHWSDKRKHITFENEKGQKVRDSNLAKTFQLKAGKEDLVHEFIRQRENAGFRRDTESLLRSAGAQADAQRKLVSESGTGREQSEAARRSAEAERRNAKDAGRTVISRETQSEAEYRERQLAQQRRLDAEKEARTVRKRNRRRSGPEL